MQQKCVVVTNYLLHESFWNFHISLIILLWYRHQNFKHRRFINHSEINLKLWSLRNKENNKKDFVSGQCPKHPHLLYEVNWIKNVRCVHNHHQNKILCICISCRIWTHRLVPKREEGRQEGELNVIEPNQGPSQESEEHQANHELEGKPHRIIYIF